MLEEVEQTRAMPDEMLDRLIGDDAHTLSGQLSLLRNRLFPPAAKTTLRRFNS